MSNNWDNKKDLVDFSPHKILECQFIIWMTLLTLETLEETYVRLLEFPSKEGKTSDF